MAQTYAARFCTYLGGHVAEDREGPGLLYIDSDQLVFGRIRVPLGRILRFEVKTEEQVRRDVTLGRLLLFGIFAFGLKKTTRHREDYFCVTYRDDIDMERTMVFRCKAGDGNILANGLARALAAARQGRAQ